MLDKLMAHGLQSFHPSWLQLLTGPFVFPGSHHSEQDSLISHTFDHAHIVGVVTRATPIVRYLENIFLYKSYFGGKTSVRCWELRECLLFRYF